MLKYLFFAIVFKALGLLPLRVLYAIADVVTAAGYLLASGARANVLDNLRHVMPDASEKKVRKSAKQVFRNVAYYYADLAHLPRMDIEQFCRERLVVRGVNEILKPAMAAGKGVVMLSAHIGNPELAVQGLVGFGIHVFALTEPQQPARLSRMMDGLRESKGHEFMPVSIGGVKRVMQTLRGGGVVALMGDRDISGPKQWLPFCGEPAYVPTGPIEVALKTGAALIPSFTSRIGKYTIQADVEEPLEVVRTGDFEADVRAAQLKYLERLERRLRTDPGQWLVLERIWDVKEQPQPEPERAKMRA
ncbi:MAG: lysophospholipid acyltransferase family protein [Dehalococcoidia bacterium]|nr:lysophospholipid acyltransferase family protein [Dehalococcoidia bacterium]